MDYTLTDVLKMQGGDLSLDDVAKMPQRQAIAKKNAAFDDRIRADLVGDMSTSDKFFSGAGKAVSDIGNGLRQIGGMVGIGDAKTTQADIDEAKRLDAPLMNTGAGLAGNVAGNVAMTLLPAGAVAKGAQGLGMARTAGAAGAFINPATYGGAAAAGAALGGLQPVASDESRLANIAAGGAAGVVGQGVVNGLGRIAQPVKNALDPIRQKAVDKLRAAGVPLDLAQVTGSPPWARISSSLGDNLFTMGAQVKKQAEQKDAFTNAALGLVGSSGKATSDVMGAADRRIGNVFEDVLSRNNVSANPSWITPLTQTHAAALENEKQPVANVINRIFSSIDPQTGEISGQVAYGIKKDLDRMAMTADSTQKYLALQAKSALMNGINDSLSGVDQKAFAEARGQFANMKKLEPAIAKDGSGEISPQIFANTMGQKANRGASIYGKGSQDAVELAQAGKMILGDKTPNSGTVARAMAMSTLPGLAIGTADALHEYGKEDGDIFSALKHGGSVAGGVIAAPKLAQHVLNSPKMVSLLSEGVTSPTLRGLLESPQKSAVASQAARSIPGLVGKTLLLPANATYAQYVEAFDKAPDAATKIALGQEYEALKAAEK